MQIQMHIHAKKLESTSNQSMAQVTYKKVKKLRYTPSKMFHVSIVYKTFQIEKFLYYQK